MENELVLGSDDGVVLVIIDLDVCVVTCCFTFSTFLSLNSFSRSKSQLGLVCEEWVARQGTTSSGGESCSKLLRMTEKGFINFSPATL